MPTPANRKMFTLERQQLGRMRPTVKEPANAVAVPMLAAPKADDNEVLKAIEALRSDLLAAGRLAGPAVTDADVEARRAEATAASEEVERYREQINLLKAEIKGLARMIAETKQEIAALRSADPDHDKITAMTSELDAVVTATEGATETILGNAESVDDLAARIVNDSKDLTAQSNAAAIGEAVIRIFEACNFQDLTGQRISKVVNTLKYVEERVNAMIEIWGAEDTLHAPKAAAKTQDADNDDHLLNGPQLENQGISQDDIDKLFD